MRIAFLGFDSPDRCSNLYIDLLDCDMRISYRLTAGEFASAQLLNYRKSFGGILMLAFYYLIAPLVGLSLLLSPISLIRLHGFRVSYGLELLLPIFIVLMPLWLPIYLRYRFRLTMLFNNACVLEFEEDHIGTEVPGLAKSTFEWAAVDSYRENKQVVLIYLSRAAFLIVPVRTFAAGEHAELVTLVRRKMSSQ